MSSVQGEFRCSRCGGLGFYDFNCNSQENYEMCRVCGMTVSDVLERDKDGEVVFNKDGSPKWTHNQYGGCGVAYEVYSPAGGIPFGRFYSLTTAKWSELRKIVKLWKRCESLGTNKGFDIKNSYIFKYDSKRHKPRVAFGGKYAKTCLKEKMQLAEEFKEENV